jgi:hypothetical protein
MVRILLRNSTNRNYGWVVINSLTTSQPPLYLKVNRKPIVRWNSTYTTGDLLIPIKVDDLTLSVKQSIFQYFPSQRRWCKVHMDFISSGSVPHSGVTGITGTTGDRGSLVLQVFL